MNTNKAKIIEIGQADFQSEVLKSNQPVLVMFCAPWSRPCQMGELVLHEIANECTGAVKVVKVNADENPMLSLAYEIQFIPTFLYFANGDLYDKIVGITSKATILAALKSYTGTA
jgi:thioredoxin 1